MVNPYGRQVYRVDLTNNTVDGFIFWTKNVGPFLKHLDEVRSREFPFIIQYTINGYPRSLEFSVVDSTRSVEHMKYLHDQFGPRVATWRYDTILFSSVTSIDFHRRNFETLAKALRGTTDEVVVSFAQIYRKTKRNMDWAAKEFDFSWEDPSDQVKHELAAELAAIAKAYGMQLSMCSQKAYLAPGVAEAHCVDAPRLAEVAGRPIVSKLKGNRPDCACFHSRDIGEYDTCPHGCVYCYAVQNRALALRRFREHDPESEFLFAPSKSEILEDGKEEKVFVQGSLF
jgi:hypothetical protein